MNQGEPGELYEADAPLCSTGPLYAARGLVSRAWGLWPPSDGCFEPRVKRASDAECHLCSARVLDSSVGWNSVIFGHRRKHSDKAINLACVYLVRQLQLNKRRTFAFFLHCCRPKLLLKTLKLLKAKNMNYCGYWCLYPLKKAKKKKESMVTNNSCKGAAEWFQIYNSLDPTLTAFVVCFNSAAFARFLKLWFGHDLGFCQQQRRTCVIYSLVNNLVCFQFVKSCEAVAGKVISWD